GRSSRGVPSEGTTRLLEIQETVQGRTGQRPTRTRAVGSRDPTQGRNSAKVLPDLQPECGTTQGVEGIHRRKPEEGIYPTITVTSRIPHLLCTKTKRKTTTIHRLSTTQRDHHQEPIPPTINLGTTRQTTRSTMVHSIRP